MRKRSKYRPRAVCVDVVSYVLSGMQRIDEHDAATSLRIRNHAALTALTKGEATRADMDELIAAFNVCEAIIGINPALGSDWKQEINAGQDALYAVAKRGHDNANKFLLTGPEMTALNLVMEIHDAQLDKITIFELEKATNLVHSFIRNGKTRRIA